MTSLFRYDEVPVAGGNCFRSAAHIGGLPSLIISIMSPEA
jgi:hypothetical protein